MMASQFEAADWDGIRLVIFDVDGTLYRPRALRIRMGRDLLLHTLCKRDLSVVSVLARYRRIRERLADEEVADFERTLTAETAKAAGQTLETVRAIVAEWVEQRPLVYLATCRCAGLPGLFAGLRGKGKSIGILSDYPAKAKLAALGLSADHVVCASDDGIGLLKPHPRGLEILIAAAGAEARTTLLIGDRIDRDGAVARRVGVRALIKSSKPIAGWQTFAGFDDPLFAPFLGC
jgi:FMN phosphatase YigB (HAD superfamily)